MTAEATKPVAFSLAEGASVWHGAPTCALRQLCWMACTVAVAAARPSPRSRFGPGVDLGRRRAASPNAVHAGSPRALSASTQLSTWGNARRRRPIDAGARPPMRRPATAGRPPPPPSSPLGPHTMPALPAEAPLGRGSKRSRRRRRADRRRRRRRLLPFRRAASRSACALRYVHPFRLGGRARRSRNRLLGAVGDRRRGGFRSLTPPLLRRLLPCTASGSAPTEQRAMQRESTSLARLPSGPLRPRVANWHFLPRHLWDPWIGGASATRPYDHHRQETNSNARRPTFSSGIDGIDLAEAGLDFKPLTYLGMGPYAELATGPVSGGVPGMRSSRCTAGPRSARASRPTSELTWTPPGGRCSRR